MFTLFALPTFEAATSAWPSLVKVISASVYRFRVTPKLSVTTFVASGSEATVNAPIMPLDVTTMQPSRETPPKLASTGLFLTMLYFS